MLKLIPVVLMLVLAGCSAVMVQNNTDGLVTVSVVLPDRKGSVTRTISPGEEAAFVSEHGGSYSVGTIPSEDYYGALRSLRETISHRLFNESSTLSGEEVAQLTERLGDVDRMLEAVRSGTGEVVCKGRLPDFESAFVVISYDLSASQVVISCL